MENHQLAVTAALILAFMIAFILMFIHPTASLTVFAIALIGLLVGLLVGADLRRTERSVARAALAGRTCPKCGKSVEHPAQQPEHWHCVACGSDFSAHGVEIA